MSKAPLPVLLDSLVRTANDMPVQVGLQQGWFVARPLLTRPLRKRVYHAWLVLTGKASAFQYAEDRINFHGGKL